MTTVWIVVLLVGLQRLAELWISHKNTTRLLAAGAYEVGAGHYPLMVLMHGIWLIGLPWIVQGDHFHVTFLVLYLLLQPLRVWVIAALEGRWTTRIIVLDGAALKTKGPYSLFRHPNYMIVAAEIALLPLAFGAYYWAIGFSLANAVILFWRIRIENRALAGAYARPNTFSVKA